MFFESDLNRLLGHRRDDVSKMRAMANVALICAFGARVWEKTVTVLYSCGIILILETFSFIVLAVFIP